MKQLSKQIESVEEKYVNEIVTLKRLLKEKERELLQVKTTTSIDD